MQAVVDVVDALKEFAGNPQKASSLGSFLGFQPIASPEDQLAGPLLGGLKRFFAQRTDRFGVKELYRVGSYDARPGTVGLWVAVLTEWGNRSTDRDRSRRRIARALIEQTGDNRSLAILVPNDLQRQHHEAEFVMPRVAAGVEKGTDSGTAVSSVRALVDLNNPNRFHRDLLHALTLQPNMSLLDVSLKWQQEFSVERVTTKFYQEYMKVRDRMAEALLAQNKDHTVVGRLAVEDARAWSTRQMGRMLFLWFLQSKRWLGESGGAGYENYFERLWQQRHRAPVPEFYRGLVVPLFFEGMANGSPGEAVRDLLRYTPYLNGGLFRTNRLEDEVGRGGEVSLPDDVFDPEQELTVLGLLSRYRFTTRESTPDDQSVDPDPELLGRVFENLYQGDERKNTGTYYTPREIVHFMCRQALDGYLRDQTGATQETLDWLRKQVTEKEDHRQPLPRELEERLVSALDLVRVCDPAVGSGAFLLGMMQEMILLRRGIEEAKREHIHDEDKLIAEWKDQAIRNCLYGVDINPEAVEICQLRLWLSQVLDEWEPPQDKPLPNLDFRIVAGDSLVDRVADITFVGSWPPKETTVGLELRRKIDSLATEMRRSRQEFESTFKNPRRLRDLRDRIARDQAQIVRLHLEDALTLAENEAEHGRNASAKKRAQARVDQIQSLIAEMDAHDFALVQKPFLWPVGFPDILQDGRPNSGFDIVLANPPYVRQEKLAASDQESYKQAFPEVYAGTADILVFFYARALQILRPGGWLAFITSNKYMRAAYGESLRDHLPATMDVHRVMDFGDLPLFEANGRQVASYPAVLVGRRNGDKGQQTLRVAELTYPIRRRLAEANLRVNPENVRWVLEDLGSLLEETEVPDYPQVLLRRDEWILEDPTLVRLFERLMNQGTPLGKFVKGRMYRGITTGLNEAFVIDQVKRDELIDEDHRSAEIIKPWLRGRDIKRWGADWPGLYVIFARRGIDIDQYPAIKEHLKWWRKELQPKEREPGESQEEYRKKPGRKPGTYKWFEIQDSTDYHLEFEEPKVIWKKTSFRPAFLFDSSGSYLGNTLHFIPGIEPWLSAVMNSAIMEFIMVLRINLLRGGYIELTPTRIDFLPIPRLTRHQEETLNQLANQLGTGDISGELKVDEVLGSAFSLSVQELDLIRKYLAIRWSFAPSAEVEDGEEDDD